MIQPRGVAEGIVAADGDQVIQLQSLQVLEHLAGHIVDLGSDPLLGVLAPGELLALEEVGQLPHLGRIGAAGMEERAAGAVDGARVGAIQGKDVVRPAQRVLQVHVGQAFPPAADAGDFNLHLAAAIDNTLDDRVQPGDVAPSGKDSDAFGCHEVPGTASGDWECRNTSL